MFNLKKIMRLEARIAQLEGKSTAISWNYGRIDLQELAQIVDGLLDRERRRAQKEVGAAVKLNVKGMDEYQAAIHKAKDAFIEFHDAMNKANACERKVMIRHDHLK